MSPKSSVPVTILKIGVKSGMRRQVRKTIAKLNTPYANYLCMSQAGSQISSVELDEVVKNALKHYIGYMNRILENEVLLEVDSGVRANAKESMDAAEKFLKGYKEGNSISIAGKEDDIKRYIVILSLYDGYLNSIDKAMHPSLREQRVVDQTIKKEHKKAVEKMYKFYALLTQIDNKKN